MCVLSPSHPIFFIQLTFSATLHTSYGAPSSAWLNYTVQRNGDIDLDVQASGMREYQFSTYFSRCTMA